jgi:Gas vesicle synthesis protein GvpL/GvpF
MTQDGNVYVYGVLAEAQAGAVSVAGVSGSAVRAVRHSGLAALVSDVDGGPLAAAREMRAHWRVLEEAAESGATILPIRFGTVMESEAAVRERLLKPSEERLAGLLRELDGRVQLSLKGQYDEDRLLREIARASPSILALRERVRKLPGDAGYYDRIRLGELVSAEVGRRKQADASLALGRLEGLAVAVHEEAPASPETGFHLAFLVERDRVDEFSAAVGKLAKEIGERARLRYLGPLPPYSFVDANLTAGDAAWA